RLTEIDPATGTIRRRIQAGQPLDDVVATPRSLWATSGSRASVVRISPRSGRAGAPIPIVSRPGRLSPFPIALAVGFGSVWVLNANTGTVSRIDPGLGAVVATIQVGSAHTPLRIVAARRAMVVASADGTLSTISPRTDRVVAAQTVAHAVN